MPESIARGSRLLGVIEAAELLGMTSQGFKDAGQPEPNIWIGDVRDGPPRRCASGTVPAHDVGPSPTRSARIVQMYRDGFSIAQTAEECGVSKASVIRIRAAEKQ